MEGDYVFPELYVKGEKGDLCANVDLENKSFELGWGDLCKVIYEEGWGRVVSPEGRALKTFLVTRGERGVYVREGSELRLVEVSGREVYLLAKECEAVEEGSRIAHVTSAKGESRWVRAGVRGVIAHIAWIPGKPEKYIYVIAEKGELLTKR